MKAARASLHLFKMLPQGKTPCMWLLVDYFISAVVIILAGIIYDSSYSMGWEDLQLIEPVLANIDILAAHGDSERLNHVRANCVELIKAATNVLEQAGMRRTQNSTQPSGQSTFLDEEVFNGLQSDPYGNMSALEYNFLNTDRAALHGFALPEDNIV